MGLCLSPRTKTAVHRPARPSHRTYLRHEASGRHYPLCPNQQTVIGRARDCDIPIEDHQASERHCAVYRHPTGGWLVSDNDSKNGTSLNGNRVHLAEMQPGSLIRVGDTRFELRCEQVEESRRAKLIGSSPAFLAALNAAECAGRSHCSVLLLGETGTGKELFARLIHDSSRRASETYVAVNCGAIPPSLVGSELFGHVAGSFTGATRDHEGYFKQAHRGTLFLDELGDLPGEQQPSFLRALETRLVRRIGARFEELVDVRVVAATHHKLQHEGSAIRSDLFHRIAQITIELPPLRDRVEDIPALVGHFLDSLAKDYGDVAVSPSVVQQLQQHRWPGNIRDLRNAVERAVSISKTPGDLQVRDFLPEGIVEPVPEAPDVPSLLGKLPPLEQGQREVLAKAYAEHKTIRRAAEELGIPKSTFADMCKRLGVDTSRRSKLRLDPSP